MSNLKERMSSFLSASVVEDEFAPDNLEESVGKDVFMSQLPRAEQSALKKAVAKDRDAKKLLRGIMATLIDELNPPKHVDQALNRLVNLANGASKMDEGSVRNQLGKIGSLLKLKVPVHFESEEMGGSSLTERRGVSVDRLTKLFKKHKGKAHPTGDWSFPSGVSAQVHIGRANGMVDKVEFQKGGKTRNFYAHDKDFRGDLERAIASPSTLFEALSTGEDPYVVLKRLEKTLEAVAGKAFDVSGKLSKKAKKGMSAKDAADVVRVVSFKALRAELDSAEKILKALK
jgi:hypothetical protein